MTLLITKVFIMAKEIMYLMRTTRQREDNFQT